MPVYQYRCQSCSTWEEETEPLGAPATRVCTVCGGLMKRNFSSVVMGKVPGGARGELQDYVNHTGNIEAITAQREFNRARKEGRDPDIAFTQATAEDLREVRKHV